MWTLNKNGVTPSLALTPVEQKNLNEFMSLVNAGNAPSIAANGWKSEYKKLGGTVNQFEIRLSLSNRATFIVDDKNSIVTMIAVGGHV